ncbi:unnamed protein product [Pleuronectes platessa]|uniref:Uncharacterized protein n=1 Tax=Pleuronectes platessa TaxID=8262 RepID=A0A9N7U9E7_PLEPL|nr:unnamed protein product [Pleuronectes platessa]
MDKTKRKEDMMQLKLTLSQCQCQEKQCKHPGLGSGPGWSTVHKDSRHIPPRHSKTTTIPSLSAEGWAPLLASTRCERNWSSLLGCSSARIRVTGGNERGAHTRFIQSHTRRESVLVPLYCIREREEVQSPGSELHRQFPAKLVHHGETGSVRGVGGGLHSGSAPTDRPTRTDRPR